MSARPLFLSIALSVVGLLALSAAADESFRYRFWMVPAEKISRSPWGDEKYYPVRMERLTRWLDSLRYTPAESSGALAEICLEGSLVDGALSEGEGEIRFSDKASPTCELAPCSVALSQLRWKEDDSAPVTSDGKGSLAVGGIVPGKELLFAWSLAPESEEGSGQIFHFRLPPAPTIRLRLTLPENLIPSVDSGLVTRLDDDGVWLIESGPGGDFRLTLSPRETSSASAASVSVSEQVFCHVAPEGIELVYTARFTGADDISGPITLSLDEPFLPEKVEWESTGAADAVWEKEGQIQKIVLPAPPAPARQVELLTLTAIAPFNEGGILSLPSVRTQEFTWQETELDVSFEAPAAPENFIFVDAGQSGSGGSLRLFKRTGSINIPLACTEEKNSFESATRVTVTGGDLQFETDLLVRAAVSGTRRLTIPIKPEWRPESVTVGGDPVPFRFETDPDPDPSDSESESAASHDLTLAFEEPISTEQPLRIRIAGRRSLTDAAPLLSDYEPLLIDEPMIGAHLLALAVEAPMKIALVDGEGRPLVSAAVPEEQIRRLFGAIPEGTVFSLVDSAPDARVRLDKALPAYTAELSGRAAISAGSISEEWTVHCVPSAGSRLDRVPVTFNTKETVPWRLTMTQSSGGETTLRMRPSTESEQTEYNLSEGDLLAEIPLSAPRSAPFTIRLARERKTSLSDGVVIPLPALCAAASQTGRIDVSTPDFTPVRLEERDLDPITPPPAEKGAVSSALASYRYTPSEKGGYGLAARDSKEDRRSGWCRYLRLESDYASTGTVRTRAVCRIENSGIPSLIVDFPESITLVNAGNVRSEEVPIPYTFHQDTRKLEIPLPIERRDLTLSFEYETQIPPFGFRGEIPRQAPQLNIPILAGDCTVNIPTEYRLDNRRDIDLTRIPLDAPVGQYRLISRYRLRILQLFVFLVGLAFGLRLKAVHMAFLTLPTILLYFVTSSEVVAQVSLGVFAASIVSAVFNFFYRRDVSEPIPVDPADEVSEIGFVTRSAVALLLTLSAALPLAADESYSIFVPARDGQRVTDEPVWIPGELQSRLTEWERENADSDGSVRFQSALYEGQLNFNRETGEYSLFHLTAKYQILTTGTDSVIDLPAMPISQEGGVLIDDVAGSVTVNRGGGRIRLELRGISAGSHRLEFSLLPEPFGEKTPEGLFLPLPSVPDAKLLLRLPTDTAAPRLLGSMGQVSTSPGILTADLGQTSGITFFPPEKGSARGETVIEAEQEFRLALSENQIVLHGEFLLHTSGRLGGVTLLADPRYRLLRCTSPDADLVPVPISESEEKITIPLRQSVSGKLTLRADFAPRDFSGVGELPLPTIRIDGAAIRSNRLLMPKEYYPREYDLTDPDAQSRSVSLLPDTAEPHISESALYRFNLRDTEVAYHAELDTGGRLWQLTLRVPQKSVIESLEIVDDRKEPVPFRESAADSLLHIFFDEAQSGLYQVDLHLRSLPSEEFPLIGILDVPASDAELRYDAVPSLYCDFTPPDDWTALPAANGQRRWSLPAAAASLLPPAMKVMPNRPKTSLVADIFFYPLAENPDPVWEFRADCAVFVDEGQMDRLEFEIDESFRADSIRIEPTLFIIGIERSPGGGRRLSLVPNNPIRGEARFVLHAQISGGKTRLPRFDLRKAEEKKVQIRLPVADGLQWQMQNLEPCAAEQLTPAPEQTLRHLPFTPTGYFPHEVTEKSHMAFNMFNTYKPSAPGPYGAEVPAKETALRLNRVETEYHVRSDGSYWGRAAYDMRLGSRQVCDIHVPPSIRLLHAEALGIPLALTPGSADGTVHLRFASESSFVRLELLFTSTSERAKSVRVRRYLYRESSLTAPIPVGVETAPTFWTVHFDHDVRQLPYYVSQEGIALDLKSIRKSFPDARSTEPLSESGHWKRPVRAEKSSALQARLNTEKLSYLLDLAESVDTKAPISPGGVAGWLNVWNPLYNGVKSFFGDQNHPRLEKSEKDAFYDGRGRDSSIASLTDSTGAEEFGDLSRRWEELSRRIEPNPSQGEKVGADPTAEDEANALSAPAPVPAESIDLVIFGVADKVRDIRLLIPTSVNISAAPFRAVLSIFALLAAAAILVAGWRTRPVAKKPEEKTDESPAPENVVCVPETDEAEVPADDGTDPHADPGTEEPSDAPETNVSQTESEPSSSSGGTSPMVLLEGAPSGGGVRVESVHGLVIEGSEISSPAPPSDGGENEKRKSQNR